MQDGTKTVPIPRLTYEAAMGSVTGDTEMVGLEALLSISTLVQDVPAAVELPRVWRSATDGAEKRHLAADEARAVDVLAGAEHAPERDRGGTHTVGARGPAPAGSCAARPRIAPRATPSGDLQRPPPLARARAGRL